MLPSNRRSSLRSVSRNWLVTSTLTASTLSSEAWSQARPYNTSPSLNAIRLLTLRKLGLLSTAICSTIPSEISELSINFDYIFFLYFLNTFIFSMRCAIFYILHIETRTQSADEYFFLIIYLYRFYWLFKCTIFCGTYCMGLRLFSNLNKIEYWIYLES